MTNIDNYEKPNGGTDWKAYDEAKRQAGEKCIECGRHMYPAKGCPAECNRCKAIERPERLDHENVVRCPDCGCQHDMQDGDSYDYFEDGDHIMNCQACDYEFTITTSVSFNFTSPARLEKS